MNLGDVSIIVTSFNREDTISSCLEDLDGFGEVLLVDSFSTDDTLEIARTRRAVIYSRRSEPKTRQLNWALRIARNDWVLLLDADEMVTEDLRREIEALDESDGVSGFWVRRRNHYLGGPMRHCGWKGDEVLRFFNRRRAVCDEVGTRETVTVAGRVSRLMGVLRRHQFGSVERHLDEIDRSSDRSAKEYVEGGGRLPLLKGLFRQPFSFCRAYVIQRGFLDGRPGFLFCLLSSYGVFLKYAKAWELLRARSGR